jgi:hypothetical protein
MYKQADVNIKGKLQMQHDMYMNEKQTWIKLQWQQRSRNQQRQQQQQYSTCNQEEY